MSPSFARALTGAAAAVVSVGLVAAGPGASAKPPAKPGTPTDLAVAVTAAPGAAYQLDSTWKPGANTTAFKVALTNPSGTVLDSAMLSTPAWHASAKAAAGTKLTVTVTPLNGTRRGTAVSKPVTMPDVTAPTGSFSWRSQAFAATISQDALDDDLSAAGAIKRSVDWGDGSDVQTWTTGTELEHPYGQKGRYVAVVVLVDEAGNQARIEVPIVIDDHTAPTAAYSVAQQTGWAKLTAVALSEDAIEDDMSPVATLTRVVAWGDGTESTWTGDAAPTHVYQVAGTFTPRVTVRDESGNPVTVDSGVATVIKADVAGPRLRLTLPSRSKRASAASWKLVKGAATDAGVGVAKVGVRAVQQRARGWYAYNPATKGWVRAGTTQTAAFKKAKTIVATRDATGRWSAPLAKVTTGKLVYRVSASDRVGNAAKPLTHAQKITRR